MNDTPSLHTGRGPAALFNDSISASTLDLDAFHFDGAARQSKNITRRGIRTVNDSNFNVCRR